MAATSRNISYVGYTNLAATNPASSATTHNGQDWYATLDDWLTARRSATRASGEGEEIIFLEFSGDTDTGKEKCYDFGDTGSWFGFNQTGPGFVDLLFRANTPHDGDWDFSSTGGATAVTRSTGFKKITSGSGDVIVEFQDLVIDGAQFSGGDDPPLLLGGQAGNDHSITLRRCLGDVHNTVIGEHTNNSTGTTTISVINSVLASPDTDNRRWGRVGFNVSNAAAISVNIVNSTIDNCYFSGQGNTSNTGGTIEAYVVGSIIRMKSGATFRRITTPAASCTVSWIESITDDSFADSTTNWASGSGGTVLDSYFGDQYVNLPTLTFDTSQTVTINDDGSTPASGEVSWTDATSDQGDYTLVNHANNLAIDSVNSSPGTDNTTDILGNARDSGNSDAGAFELIVTATSATETREVLGTASAASSSYASAVVTEAVLSTASAEDGRTVSASLTEAVQATASAEDGRIASSSVTQSAQATASAQGGFQEDENLTVSVEASATASAGSGVVISWLGTESVLSTASASSQTPVVSESLTQSVLSEASAVSGRVASASVTQSALATASAQHGLLDGEFRTDAVLASASASSGHIASSSVTVSVAATATVEDGFITDSSASRTSSVLATASASSDLSLSQSFTGSVSATAALAGADVVVSELATSEVGAIASAASDLFTSAMVTESVAAIASAESSTSTVLTGSVTEHVLATASSSSGHIASSLISRGVFAQATVSSSYDAAQPVIIGGIGDFENAMRVRASQWAALNGVAFVFDNAVGHNPTVDPTQTTLVWSWRPNERDRLTGSTIEHRGSCLGTIMQPTLPSPSASGNPVTNRFQLAQSLVNHFRGQKFGNGEVLDESGIATIPSPQPVSAVEADIQWFFREDVKCLGYIGQMSGDGAVAAYNGWRERMSDLDLQATVFYDGVPPGLALELPAAVCSFSVSPGVPVSMHVTSHTGQILVGLHYELETGVQLAQRDVTSIVSAFDSVSVGSVSFGVPQTTVIGRTAGETWQVNVRLPFVFQDIFTS